jgi:ABC-2 type transport system permease protein
MLRFLLEKEFKQLFRNPFLPRMIAIYPLVALFLFPLAASFDIHNLDLAVVDLDRSPAADRLVRKALASGYFRLGGYEADYGSALGRVELGAADLILEIPRGFERDLAVDRSARVFISADNVDSAKGGLGSAYLARIVDDYAADLGAAEAPPETAPAGGSGSRPSVYSRFRFNPRLSYPVMMVPAIVVMVLTMFCGFLPALNIVGEKEAGTMEQMNVTPVRRLDFILSKLIPYWVVGFFVLTVCFAIARFAYGLIPRGNLLVLYLFSSVFILAVSGFGLVISNYAATIQQAMFMMFFFVVTFILLSGLYTPVESMPDWARIVSDLSPLYYYIRVMRLVYLKGNGLGELVQPLAALVSFAVFFNVWAVASYRKRS